jgi:hypothetical protein
MLRLRQEHHLVRATKMEMSKIGGDLRKWTLGRDRPVFGSLAMSKITKLSRRQSNSRSCAAPTNRNGYVTLRSPFQ